MHRSLWWWDSSTTVSIFFSHDRKEASHTHLPVDTIQDVIRWSLWMRRRKCGWECLLSVRIPFIFCSYRLSFISDPHSWSWNSSLLQQIVFPRVPSTDVTVTTFFLACLSLKCVFFSSGILFFVWKVYFSWAPNSILSRLFLRSRVASNFSFRFNPRIGFSHLSICPLFRILSCHRLPLHPFSLLCLVSLYTWVSLVVFFTQSFHLCFKITSSNAESILHPLGGLCHMPHRLVKQSVLIFKCLTRTKAPDNNPYTNALLWSSCRFLFHPVWNFN